MELKKISTKQEVIECICDICNSHCLIVEECYAFEHFKNDFDLVLDDFYNDYTNLSSNDVKFGQYNWKPSKDVSELKYMIIPSGPEEYIVLCKPDAKFNFNYYDTRKEAEDMRGKWR